MASSPSLIGALRSLQNSDISSSEKKSILNEYWELACHVLGHKRTREELIPCLREVVSNIILKTDTEDDSLFLIRVTSVAKNSLEYVGGPKYVKCLLELLTDLCESSDIEIRDPAIRAFVSLVRLSLPEGYDGITNQIDMLYASESPELQLTTCHLCPLLLTIGCDREPSVTQSLFQGFLDIFKSNRPASRREAVTAAPAVVVELLRQLKKYESLPTFSEAAVATTTGYENISNTNSTSPRSVLRNMLEKTVDAAIELASNDQEATRLHAVTSTTEILVQLDNEVEFDEIQHKLKLTLDRATEDSSWMVRCAVIKLFSKVTYSECLIDKFYRLVGFFHDPEVEVRIAAIHTLSDLVKEYGSEIQSLPYQKQTELLESLRTSFLSLCNDVTIDVRMTVAEQLIPIANSFNTKIVIQSLFAVFLRYLRDDSNKVRLEALKSLIPSPSLPTESNNNGSLTLQKRFLLGVKDPGPSSLASALDPFIIEPQWRLRETILTIGTPLFRDTPTSSELYHWLEELLLNSLTDSVYSIRIAAAKSIGEAATILGPQWVHNMVFPRLDELQKSSNYLSRITASHVLNALILFAWYKEGGSLSIDIKFIKQINDILKQLSNDKVSNVRLHIIQSLTQCIEQLYLPPLVTDSIVDICKNLSEDADQEIRILVQRLNELLLPN